MELRLVDRIWTSIHIDQGAFISRMKNIWQTKYMLTSGAYARIYLYSSFTIGVINSESLKDNFSTLTNILYS